MSTGWDQSPAVAMQWAQEWYQLSRSAIDEATGHYLQGCANVAMAHSPLPAVEAMLQTQAGLLSDSAHMLAQVSQLWHKQNTELFVTRAEHQRTPDATDQT